MRADDLPRADREWSALLEGRTHGRRGRGERREGGAAIESEGDEMRSVVDRAAAVATRKKGRRGPMGVGGLSRTPGLPPNREVTSLSPTPRQIPALR